MSQAYLDCSQRMQSVQSPIIPAIATLIRDNPGTISLGQGVVYYGPPENTFDDIDSTMSQYEKQLYGPVTGIVELIDAIKTKLARENNIFTDTHSKIVVTAGANMGFLNSLFAITEPDDEVILLSPYYFNHEMAITMLNCHVKAVATDEHYQPNLNALEQAITSKTKAIVTVSPNNPSGVVYSKETLIAINQFCLEQGLYHISDEAYEYFVFNGQKHFSPGSLKNSDKQTISLFSFSKSYGFASWRMGYMIVPEHLFEAIQKIQDTNLICPPLINQYAAINLLKKSSSYCRKKLTLINANRELCLKKLKEIKEFCTFPNVDGGFYIFLKLKTTLDSFTVAKRLIEEYKVAVIPGNTFGMHSGCYLRLSYGSLSSQELNQAMERLCEGISRILTIPTRS